MVYTRVMGLLSKLKSMLGLEETERAPGSGVDVTVEHEPDADSERAVKESVEDGEGDGASSGGDTDEEEPAAAGTDAAASTESLVDEDASDDADRAAEPAEAAGTAAGGEEADDGDDDGDDDGEDAAAEPDDLTEIKGVGPAYAERLEDAGVTTFAGLAEADPEELAAATDLSPKRVGRWVDRAGDHR